MRRTEERAGLCFAALCALNASFVPAVAKLTTDRADPLFVAMMTTACAGLTALAVVIARGDLVLLLHPRIGPRLLAVGAIGTGAAFWLLFRGARGATAIETTLCLQIEPAYALAAAWLVLGHPPTRRRIAAVAVLVVGIALALGARGTALPAPGVWPLLATPLCWQLSHLIVLRELGGVPSAVLTGARYVYGGLVLVLAWVLAGAPTGIANDSSLAALAPALTLQGVVLAYFGTMMWYEAIARLDLTRTTAIVVPSTPLLALVAAFVLLGERPTATQWVGVSLTAAGVIAFVTAPHAVSTRARVPIWTAPLAAPRARDGS